MKKILIMIFMLFSALSANALTISGSVSYDETTARALAFDGIPHKINMGQFGNYKYDTFSITHIANFKAGINEDTGMLLCPFYAFKTMLLGYAIKYDTDKYHTYHYDKTGILNGVDVSEKPQGAYPNRAQMYDYAGNLYATVFVVDKANAFTFKKDGSLEAKWVGNVRYNAKGKVMPMSRQLPY